MKVNQETIPKKGGIKIALKIAGICVGILVTVLMSVVMAFVASMCTECNAWGAFILVTILSSFIVYLCIKAIINLKKYGYSEKPTAGYIREIKPVAVQIPKGPHFIAIDPDTNIVYVSCNRSNLILAIDGSTNMVVGYHHVDKPGEIAINPSTNKLYVITKWKSAFTGHLDGGTQILVIDTIGNKIICQIGEGETFCRLAINPDTNTVYATSPSTGLLYVMDGNTGNIITKIEVGTDKVKPTGVTVNRITNKAFVSYYNSTAVSVIDGSKNNPEYYYELGRKPAAADRYTADLSVNPSTNMLYVLGRWTFLSDYGYPSEKDTLYTIDLNSESLKDILWSRQGIWEHFYLGNNGHNTMAVNPMSNRLYLTNLTKKELLIMDSSTCKILDAIRISKDTDCIAVDPIPDRVYITNSHHLEIQTI